jgi:hypothetical protein
MNEILKSTTKVEKVFISRKSFGRVNVSVGNIRHVDSNEPLEIKFLDRPASSKKLIGHNFDVNPDSKIEIEECINGGLAYTNVSEFSTKFCRIFEIDMEGNDKPKKINRSVDLRNKDKGIIVINRKTLNDLTNIIFGFDVPAMLVTRK